MSKWISVKDRLPDADVRVLIWYERADKNKFEDPRAMFGRWCSVRCGWVPEGWHGTFDDDVLFWQPAPGRPERTP